MARAAFNWWGERPREPISVRANIGSRGRSPHRSVGNFISFLVPFGQRLQSLVPEELFHDQLAFANGQSDFAIDEVVIESDFGGVFAGVPVEKFRNACPINRRETHRAWFATRVKFAVFQVEGFETATSIADGNDFGV